MKVITFYYTSIILLCFMSCTNVKPVINKNVQSENIEPIKEYFFTTMTLYDKNRQPYLGMVEINEKEAFIEMIREILDNPDYEYSSFQNDLYYVAQIYNAFSVAEFTGRDSSTYEKINSSGTQSTYKNVINGQLMDIRTQLNKVRYSESIKYLLDNGYYIHTETFGNTQTILTIDYRSKPSESNKETHSPNSIYTNNTSTATNNNSDSYFLLGYSYSDKLPLGITMGSNYLYLSLNFGVGGTEAVNKSLSNWSEYPAIEWIVGFSFPLTYFLFLPIGIGGNHSFISYKYSDKYEGFDYKGQEREEIWNNSFVMEIGLMPVIFKFFYFSATYRLTGFKESSYTLGAGFKF